jgi:FkbM family methyltransferase
VKRIKSLQNTPWLFKKKFFRNFLFRLLRKDRLPIVSRQMEDHLILFSPSGVIGRRLMVHGDWNKQHVHLAISLLTKHGFSFDNKVALDIGANIGTQTIYIHLLGLFSKIIAVEPEANIFFLLKTNVEVNDFKNKTQLINAALSEESGTVSLYINEGYSDGGNSLLSRRSLTASVDVEAVTLDDVLKRAKTAPEEVGFCWIDTEGYDYICTKQIVNRIGTKVPIFTEISNIFEGKDAAQNYLTFLNKNFKNCYVFEGDAEPVLFTENNASITTESADLLLFN